MQQITGGYCLALIFVVDPSANCEWCDQKRKKKKREILPPHEFLMGTASWGSKPSNFGGFGRVWDLLFLPQIPTSVADSFAHWTLRDLSTEWKLRSSEWRNLVMKCHEELRQAQSVTVHRGLVFETLRNSKWVCLKIGYIPNEIAIFHRDNDHENHWV